MRKFFALLLALCMIISLAACSDASLASSAPTPEPKFVVGAWEAKLKLVDIAGEELGDMGEMFKDVNIDMVLEMKENKTFTMGIDTGTALPALKEAMTAYIKQTVEAEGKTLEQYEEEKGQTVDQMTDEALQDIDFSDAGVNSAGTYTEENGKLVLTQEDGTTIEGNWFDDTLNLVADNQQISFTRK